MSTLTQITANRRNARHGTGPKTASGKARSRHNARRSGVSQAFDVQAADVIALAQEVFPQVSFRFAQSGPNETQAAALRLAAAELRIGRIRARMGDVDARINALLGRAERLENPYLRGLKRLFDEIGVTANSDPTVVAALTSLIKYSGSPALLDPVTQALRDYAHLKRYRREAEAQRRQALAALPAITAAELAGNCPATKRV
jgi:hypothetical protein